MVVKAKFIRSSADEFLEREEQRKPDMKMLYAIIVALIIFFCGCVVGYDARDQRAHQDYFTETCGENSGTRR